MPLKMSSRTLGLKTTGLGDLRADPDPVKFRKTCRLCWKFRGPNPSPEDGNRFDFRNVVLSSYLEFWTVDKVQKPFESVCYGSGFDFQQVEDVVCSTC
jgi:hypothetical protein